MGIRKIEQKDSQGVKDLVLSILTSEYPFDKKAFSDSDLNNILQTYSGAREIFLVLEIDNNVIGTIGVKEESKNSALIRRFFVASEFRGKGHGKKLMEEAIKFCRSKDYTHVIFQGTDRMVQAIELCKKVGFTEREHIDMGGFFIHKFILDL